MKTKNLTKLFFLMFAFVAFTTNAQSITVSKWQVHKGIDIEPIAFDTQVGYWGDPAAYVKKNIPTQNHLNWKTVDKIKVEDKSTLTPFKQLDFTYFQRTVHIPKGTKITKFEIEFEFVDDGARVYVFNDKHPNGAFQPGTDWTLKDWNDARKVGKKLNFVIKNFGSLLTEGNNRIVIVQFDNHKGGNVVKGVKMVVNGTNNGVVINKVTQTNKTVQEMETPKSEIIGHWTFENGSKKDLTENFEDLKLTGASIHDGQLYVNRGTFAETKKYTGPNVIDKTLVAWTTITDTLNQGGSVLTIGRPSPNYDFDAIVFGERQSKVWMAGSGWWKRTRDLGNLALETNIGSQVKMAITYKSKSNNQTEVTIYRNDVKISSYTQGNMLTFATNATGVIFGKRHFYGGLPSNPWIDASIEEARIYSGVLNLEELKKLKPNKTETVQVQKVDIPDISKSTDQLWAYGHGTSGQNFTKFKQSKKYKANSPVTIMTDGSTYFSAGQNTSDIPWTDTAQSITFPPKSEGAIALHPGSKANEYAKVKYTASQSGNYKVNLKFNHLDDQFSTAKGEIWTKNGLKEFKLTKQLYTASNGTIKRDFTINLNKGDTIIVGVERDGSYANDYTLVTFEIDLLK